MHYSRPQRPPSPEQTDQWEEILEHEPRLAPAQEKVEPDLCRVADGTANWLELANTYRSERLQALGNGVDPMVAAVAWSVLMDRFNE